VSRNPTHGVNVLALLGCGFELLSSLSEAAALSTTAMQHVQNCMSHLPIEFLLISLLSSDCLHAAMSDRTIYLSASRLMIGMLQQKINKKYLDKKLLDDFLIANFGRDGFEVEVCDTLCGRDVGSVGEANNCLGQVGSIHSHSATRVNRSKYMLRAVCFQTLISCT
jgi:hypothetical protein